MKGSSYSKWLFSMALLTGPLFGEDSWEEHWYEEYESCENCHCLGSFSIGGNWLYMRPLGSKIEFARVLELKESGFPQIYQGNHEFITTRFDSGYELFAFYRSPVDQEWFGWDLRASFLSHDFSSDQSVEASLGGAILPSFGFIPEQSLVTFSSSHALLRDDFQSATIDVGGFLCSESIFFRFGLGVHGADLRRKLTVSYFDPLEISIQGDPSSTNIVEVVKCRGIGPRLSFEGKVDLFCGFSFIGDFGGALLFSEKKGEFDQYSLVGNTIFSGAESPEFFREIYGYDELIPGLDGRVGLSFTIESSCLFSLSITGGYRAMYYFAPFNHMEITGQAILNNPVPGAYATTTARFVSRDYGLSGWFLGANLLF